MARLRTLGLLMASLSLPTFAAYFTSSTFPHWDANLPDSGTGIFGSPDTATYGQVVQAPTGATSLDRFTFLVRANIAVPLPLRAHVYAWDGDSASGPSLFSSGAITMTQQGANAYQPVQINTGGVAVTAGTLYVLFFSTSQDQSLGASAATLASLGNLYPSGSFVSLNNGANTGAWTTSNWNVSQSLDLNFQAIFTDRVVPSPAPGPTPTAVPLPDPITLIPEPSSMALMSSALAGLGFLGRRRRG